MKTTGVSGIPKFGLFDFLGHPNMYATFDFMLWYTICIFFYDFFSWYICSAKCKLEFTHTRHLSWIIPKRAFTDTQKRNWTNLHQEVQGSLRQLTENLHGPTNNEICRISRVARGHKDVSMSPRSQEGTIVAKKIPEKEGWECLPPPACLPSSIEFVMILFSTSSSWWWTREFSQACHVIGLLRGSRQGKYAEERKG